MSERMMSEDDIAAYLLNTPDFFERNADLLASVQLTSPHGQRAVSLQERQMELLRSKIKGLELQMANMIRAGSENDQINQKLLDWTRLLLQESFSAQIPSKVVKGLLDFFNVPHMTLRIWGVDSALISNEYTRPVSENVLSFVKSMNGEPYCGHNPDLEVVHWLDNAAEIRSVALLPLHIGAPQNAFGLLVLGSTDAQRFTSDMGIDILKNIAAIASAALTRCLIRGEHH